MNSRIRKRLHYCKGFLLRLPKWKHRMFFSHVPKCAGTAINRSIRSSFRSIPITGVNLTASGKAAEIMDVDVAFQRLNFFVYEMSKNRPGLFTGHCPCPPFVRDAFVEDVFFSTVLREPVDRWLSEFVYNSYKTQDWAKNEIPIKEFLKTPKAEQMGMTYSLYFGLDKNGGSSVERAVDNLSSFDLVGFQDNMTGFQYSLSEKLECDIQFTNANKSPKPEARTVIEEDENIMKSITRLCQSDLEIWRQIRSLLIKH